MTVDEIKQELSMADVIARYGLKPNRSGFIFCPFHQEKGHASMRIYKRDYNCFGCGANGDIFTFVQEMEHCDFKTAYLSLGGEYQKRNSWQKKRFRYQLEQKKQKAMTELVKKKTMKLEVLRDIFYQKLFVRCFPVYSDEWCEAVNRIEYDFYLLDELTREGVKLND